MSIKDLVICSGTGTLAAGTLTVVNPNIVPTSVVLTNVSALGGAGGGLHLAAVPVAGQVVFTSIDAAGAIVGGDAYSFTYVVLNNNLAIGASG